MAGKLAGGGARIALGLVPVRPEPAQGIALVAVVSHDLAYDAPNAALARGYRNTLLAETGRFQNAWLSDNLATPAGPALRATLGLASFLFASQLLLAARIWRPPQSVEPDPREREHGWKDAFLGFAWELRQPLLRTFTLPGFLAVLGFGLGRALDPMIGLDLGVPEPALGLFLGAATVGSLVANLLGPRLGGALNVWLGIAPGAVGSLVLTLSPNPFELGTTVLRVGGFTIGLLGLRVFRQWLLPRALVGRGVAAISIVIGIAGVTGTALAAAIGGSRPLLTLVASGYLSAAALFLLSLWHPPRQLREIEGRLAQEAAG